MEYPEKIGFTVGMWLFIIFILGTIAYFGAHFAVAWIKGTLPL